MTQRDYVKFANAIKEELDREVKASAPYTKGYRAGIETIARRIAEICRADNERFDSDQFLKAAGIE